MGLSPRAWSALGVSALAAFAGGRYGVYRVSFTTEEWAPIATLAFFLYWALGDVSCGAAVALGAFESFVLSTTLAAVAGSLAPSVTATGGDPWYPPTAAAIAFVVALAATLPSSSATSALAATADGGEGPSAKDD